jgi:hypothetical protein
MGLSGVSGMVLGGVFPSPSDDKGGAGEEGGSTDHLCSSLPKIEGVDNRER